MAIDRRSFLVGSVLALSSRGARAGDTEPRFASACRLPDGTYAVALLDQRGRVVRELPLIDRAHDIATHPGNDKAVVFARQPGQFALAFSWLQASEPALFAPPENRCFFGHGVFSRDGRLLYGTENSLDDGRGLIGVYDAGAAFRRIGEMDSHGIGPHEVVLMPDGITLACAAAWNFAPVRGVIGVEN